MVVHILCPGAYSRPAGNGKIAHLSLISFDVGFQLREPEVALSPRKDIMVGASVPEATVDEHGQLLLGKDRIWAAPWGHCVKWVAKTATQEGGPQVSLKPGVLGPNPSHLL